MNESDDLIQADRAGALWCELLSTCAVRSASEPSARVLSTYKFQSTTICFSQTFTNFDFSVTVRFMSTCVLVLFSAYLNECACFS